MKIYWTAAILALSIARGAGVPSIDVWIDDDVSSAKMLELHKTLVSSLFAEIGVQIQWHDLEDGQREAGAPGFEIRVVRQALPAASAAALASTVIATSAITVFEDRVRQRAGQSHPGAAKVLPGYVIAHELAHAIQGISRHSDNGILKADWSNDDCTAMLFEKLKFSDFDALLIRQRAAYGTR